VINTVFMRGNPITLISPAVVILAWQQVPQHWLWIGGQFLNVAQSSGNNAGTHIDVFHFPRSLIDLLLHRR